MFAPDFHDKLERTRKELLHEMAKTWIPRAKGVVKRGKSTMLVDREPKETTEIHSPPSNEDVGKTENGATSPHPPPIHLSSSPSSSGEAWTKELVLLKDKLKGKLNKEKMSIRYEISTKFRVMVTVFSGNILQRSLRLERDCMNGLNVK